MSSSAEPTRHPPLQVTLPAHSVSEVHVTYGADDGGIGFGKVGREELVQFKGVRPYALQSDREAESPSLRLCQSLLGGSPPSCE